MDEHQSDIRNKAALPEVMDAFFAGKQSGVCPRCGSSDADPVWGDGGLEEGWQKNMFRCYDCGTEWSEEFECDPRPLKLTIDCFEEERVEDGPCESHQGSFSDEELEEIVDEIIANR